MILFQLHFEVAEDRCQDFEKTYAEVFAPAVSRQQGFGNAKLIRFYAPQQTAEIEASATEYNYQVNFTFESEALRRRWAASKDHDVAWPRLSGIARKFLWRGYDVVG